jgi:hypothetical protein
MLEIMANTIRWLKIALTERREVTKEQAILLQVGQDPSHVS